MQVQERRKMYDGKLEYLSKDIANKELINLL